jgi:hypothetical protein
MDVQSKGWAKSRNLGEPCTMFSPRHGRTATNAMAPVLATRVRF